MKAGAAGAALATMITAHPAAALASRGPVDDVPGWRAALEAAAAAPARPAGDADAALATRSRDMAAALAGGLPRLRASAAAGRRLPMDAPDVRALNDEDADAAAAARDAAAGMMADILAGDAAGAVDLAHVARIARPGGDAEWRCLAKAIYFESRGEPLKGQIAVAEVILNRRDDPRFPDTVCDVVAQGSKRPGCQFSFMCDGRPETIRDRAAYALAGNVAHMMLEGRPRTITGAATHFHTAYVRPGWARRMVKTIRVGDHLFYRERVRTAEN
jgi:hypothetical protein